MATFFDNLFSAADAVLDEVFAGPATYRAAGTAIAVTASIRSLGVATDGERDVPSDWLGYAVELTAAELLVDGQPWEPIGGDEIAFVQGDGSLKVYRVVANANGRAYEPLDFDGRKLLVFVKYIRTEN